MSEKTSAEIVIDALGGLTKTAKALSASGKAVAISTVQGWKERGRIPEEYWAPLVVAGKESGVVFTPKDFMSPATAEAFGEMPETAA